MSDKGEFDLSVVPVNKTLILGYCVDINLTESTCLIVFCLNKTILKGKIFLFIENILTMREIGRSL